MRIPLRNREKEIVAYTIIDDQDAHFADHRWFLGQGYARRGVWRDGKVSLLGLHREIMRPPPGMQVDHVNRDRLDNTRANLRIVTTAQQAQNRTCDRGSSPYRGVSWVTAKGKWCAQAMLAGKNYHLGYFEDALEAAAVASEWRLAHMTHAYEDAYKREVPDAQ